ncbi:MAG: helix-turn-helix transcriptional regulator [Pseudomonadota bacterium]
MLRAERGLSRKQLADVLDVHYQTIGYIERGEFMPSLEIAIKAAQYFGLPVETVFSLEPFAPLSASNLSTVDKDAKAS